MKLLVLGGTIFLGRHVVHAALRRGVRVTTFTRGRTNPGLFPGVEALTGDRDGDLAALRGRTWDAVVDTSAYRPRQAAAAAAALRGAVGRYAFVSTASVYAAFPPGGAAEDAATHAPPADPDAAVGPETYGPLKVACERAVVEAFGGRALVTRPGLLVGPHDPTGRFTYWVRRVREGGEVLAPGDPARQVQLLDARDLAAWLVGALEAGLGGVYNASGPAAPLTMAGLLDTCRTVAGSDARLTWVDDPFLLAQGVAPWSDLPLWLPAEAAGLLLTDSRRAQDAGLRCRPLGETVTDLLAAPDVGAPSPGGGPPRPPAVTRARERELLHAWHAAARVTGGPAERALGPGAA